MYKSRTSYGQELYASVSSESAKTSVESFSPLICSPFSAARSVEEGRERSVVFIPCRARLRAMTVGR